MSHPEPIPGIVGRLRLHHPNGKLCREAADHIERLTSALEGMESIIPLFAEHCGGSEMPLLAGLQVVAAREQARTALSLIKEQGRG